MTFIIAEAGVNHNGDIAIAKKLVDVAVEAGVDAVKFQTFKADRLACKNADKAEYQLNTTDNTESQFDMLRRLELTEEMHIELLEYCKEKGIMFMSTPFDCESIDLLESMNLEIYKIPSGEITNYPYLKKIAQTGKKLIISTGMSTLQEIMEAMDVLYENGAKDVRVLHCNTEYPTPMKDVNLNAIKTMKDKLHIPIGYSDHTKGTEVAIAAVALGADIIEKHFTLDRNMDGPDHKASIEPEELNEMVRSIRNIELAMGSGIKTPSESERKNINIARKSIVAQTDIKNGEMFTEDNITCKRPGNGISPMRWNDVLGQTATRDYYKDDLIEI